MDFRKRKEEQQAEKENSFSPSSLFLFFPKEQFEDSGCKKSKKDRNGCIMTPTVCHGELVTLYSKPYTKQQLTNLNISMRSMQKFFFGWAG